MGAVYAVFAAALAPFTLYWLPRQMNSLHPGAEGSPAFSQTDLAPAMRPVFYAAAIGFIGLFWVLYTQRVRLALLKRRTPNPNRSCRDFVLGVWMLEGHGLRCPILPPLLPFLRLYDLFLFLNSPNLPHALSSFPSPMTIHPLARHARKTPRRKTRLQAQTEEVPTQAPDALERVMLAEDKLYVVLAVVLIIWLGLRVLPLPDRPEARPAGTNLGKRPFHDRPGNGVVSGPLRPTLSSTFSFSLPMKPKTLAGLVLDGRVRHAAFLQLWSPGRRVHGLCPGRGHRIQCARGRAVGGGTAFRLRPRSKRVFVPHGRRGRAGAAGALRQPQTAQLRGRGSTGRSRATPRATTFVANHILVKCPSKYNDARGLEETAAAS